MGENKLFILSFFLSVVLHVLFFSPVVFKSKSTESIFISLIHELKKDREPKNIGSNLKSKKYRQKNTQKKIGDIFSKVTLNHTNFEGVLKVPIIDKKNIVLLESIEKRIRFFMEQFNFHGVGKAVFTVEFDSRGNIKSVHLNGIEGDEAIVDDIKKILYLGQPYFKTQNFFANTYLVQLHFEVTPK